MARSQSNAFRVSTVKGSGAGTWSFKTQSAGPYYPASKHTALLYDPERRQIIQCGGDFNGGSETAPNGAVFSVGSTRRDMWVAGVDAPSLGWQKVQPIFMPAGREQGPALGPDQVWFWRRTAVTPVEFWVGPGFYRPHVDRKPFGAYAGEDYLAFRWRRPGWDRPARQRRKVPFDFDASQTDVFRRRFGESTEPDKFCAYDERTDCAYCINDFFEVIKYDHRRDDWDHAPDGDAYVNLYGRESDDHGRGLDGAAEISIGGSQQAIVGRRVYALAKWRNASNADVRSYLVWFDIDAVKVGAITCPFDIDPQWPVPGRGNPEEHAMLAAINGKLVVTVTYFGAAAGERPLWVYDPATRQWTNGAPVPQWIGGNAIVAVPDQNAVYLMGSTANPATSDNGWRTAAIYRID